MIITIAHKCKVHRSLHKPMLCCARTSPSRATPADNAVRTNDEFPDATLFRIEGDTGGSELATYLQTRESPAGWPMRKKRALIMQARHFTWAAGALYKLGKDGICKDGVLRRCIPEGERIELLEEAHEGKAGGHMSREVTTRKLLEADYWWDSLEEWAKGCDVCQRIGRPLSKDMGPLQSIQPLVPFMKWGIDFMGPFKNMGKYKYIVAAVFGKNMPLLNIVLFSILKMPIEGKEKRGNSVSK